MKYGSVSKPDRQLLKPFLCIVTKHLYMLLPPLADNIRGGTAVVYLLTVNMVFTHFWPKFRHRLNSEEYSLVYVIVVWHYSTHAYKYLPKNLQNQQRNNFNLI